MKHETPTAVSDWLSMIGRVGGRKAAENMTRKARVARAKKAARAAVRVRKRRAREEKA